MNTDVGTVLPEQQTAVNYPWLLFQLENNYFAINSQRVTGIMICPEEMTRLPDSPDFVRGLIMMRGSIVRLLDLRMLFGIETIDLERERFHEMLEQRKHDHLNWVLELERCIEEEEPFQLATDPHKCAFGRWYDSYEAENNSVAHHLRKIEEPHRRLHEAALSVNSCDKNHDACNRERCLKTVMKELKEELVPRIVSLLDEAQDVFRESYREMAIIIEEGGRRLGLIVDQVLSVEDIARGELNDVGVNFFHDLTYIDGVCQSRTVSENVLIVNDKKLLDMTGDDSQLSEELL